MNRAKPTLDAFGAWLRPCIRSGYVGNSGSAFYHDLDGRFSFAESGGTLQPEGL